MDLSPLAQRPYQLLTGTAKDPTYWADAAQLSVGLGAPVRKGDGSRATARRYAIDEQTRQQLAAPARELVGFLLRDGQRLYEPFCPWWRRGWRPWTPT